MSAKEKLRELEQELAQVINRHGLDNMVSMPDYVIAEYVVTTISALKRAHVANEAHKSSQIAEKVAGKKKAETGLTVSEQRRIVTSSGRAG